MTLLILFKLPRVVPVAKLCWIRLSLVVAIVDSLEHSLTKPLKGRSWRLAVGSDSKWLPACETRIRIVIARL